MYNTEQREHYWNIDILRCTACIAVVGLHTIAREVSCYDMALYLFCCFAVPMFFMISGYLQCGRQADYRQAFKKIFHTLRLIVIWSGIVSMVEKWLFPDGAKFSWGGILRTFLLSFLQRGHMWQMWYLWITIILWLLIPLINRMNSFEKKLLWGLCFVVSVVMQVYSYATGESVQGYIPQTLRVWIAIEYYLLGMFIHRLLRKIQGSFAYDRKMKNEMGIVTLLLMSVLYISWLFFTGERFMPIAAGEYYYDDIVLAVWVIMIFIVISCIKIDNRILNWASFIAPYTLGIYIIHPLMIRIIQNIISINTTVEGIALWGYGFISSLLICVLIKKIPYLRRIIEL